MDAGDLVDKVPLSVVLVLIAAPGLFAVWKQWAAERRDAAKQRADLVKIAQDAARGVIEDLQAHVDRLNDRIQALEDELMQARMAANASMAASATTIVSKDAELALLRGRLRQALANLDAYDRLLTANQIPHDHPAQPIYLVEAGDDPSEVRPL